MSDHTRELLICIFFVEKSGMDCIDFTNLYFAEITPSWMMTIVYLNQNS